MKSNSNPDQDQHKNKSMSGARFIKVLDAASPVFIDVVTDDKCKPEWDPAYGY